MKQKQEMKILVVDDMATMRKIVKNILLKAGFVDITEADDGTTAWECIKEAQNRNQVFDLIVSDWNMPQMKGIELLQKVRAISEMKKLPFLMVTAEAEKNNIVEALQEGVSHYIVKPFTPVDLMEKVEKVLKS